MIERLTKGDCMEFLNKKESDSFLEELEYLLYIFKLSNAGDVRAIEEEARILARFVELQKLGGKT